MKIYRVRILNGPKPSEGLYFKDKEVAEIYMNGLHYAWEEKDTVLKLERTEIELFDADGILRLVAKHIMDDLPEN